MTGTSSCPGSESMEPLTPSASFDSGSDEPTDVTLTEELSGSEDFMRTMDSAAVTAHTLEVEDAQEAKPASSVVVSCLYCLFCSLRHALCMARC